MVIYRCEDSLESIFTAVYRAYEEHRDHEDTRILLHDEPILFAEDIRVEKDANKAVKVMRTLERKFGEKDYFDLCSALATEDEDKADAVYHTIVQGLKNDCYPEHLYDNLADPHVLKTFKLAKYAWREIHHLYGFVRFQELTNGILFASIGPRNNILTFLMPHFADRFPSENFVIYDEIRGIFGIHPAGKQWFLQIGEEKPVLKYSEEEQIYSELFRAFVSSIAIESRRNLDLQRNMLPLRFREYMIEF